VISKKNFRDFLSNILRFSIILTATQNHIYKTALRQQHSQMSLLLCSIFFPMPQLTPDCDRIIVIKLPTDGTDFVALYVCKLIQMVMEITITEDYCRSYIFVMDYVNVTLRHVTKITPSWVKKYELCAVVSSTNNFYVFNNSRA
jgi:hypothetical protein